MSLVLAMPVLGWLAPVRVVLRTIGAGLSTASLVSALRAMEKETPSLHRAERGLAFCRRDQVHRAHLVVRAPAAPVGKLLLQPDEICGRGIGPRALAPAAGVAMPAMAAPAASC